MEFSFDFIITLITLISLACVSVLVYLRDRRSLTNKSLALFSALLGLWAFFNYFSLNSKDSVEVTLFWIRAVMLVTSFLGPAAYVLVTTFPKTSHKYSIKEKVMLAILALVPAATSFTPLMFQSVNIDEAGMITPSPGPAIIFFALSFVGLPLLSCILFMRKFFKSKGSERAQHKFLLIGLGITILFYTFTNFIMVVIFNNSSLVVFGPLTNLIFVGFTAYAIVRHKLLDIRLILVRTFSFVVLFGLFSFIYVNWLLSVTNALRAYIEPQVEIIINVLVVLFIALTFHPLLRKVQRFSNKLFFQEVPDDDEFLSEVGKIVSRTLDVRILAKSVGQKVAEAFQIEKVSFLVCGGSGLRQVYSSGDNKKIDYENLENDLQGLKQKLVQTEDIEKEGLKKVLDSNNFDVVMKFTRKDKALGYLLLGEKRSGSGYYGRVLQLFELIAPIISVSLNNALQFSEIEQFGETMKQEVHKATTKLSLANAKLKELDQLKDEFLSVAAHELRAPLTAVKGYLSMVTAGDAGKVPAKAKEFVQGAIVGAEREIRLINNLLNVSRIEENRLVYKMAVVELKKVAKQVTEEFKLSAEEKGLDINLNIEKNINDKVYVDPDRIHEVVGNFVSNAVKYTDKGHINISLSQPKKTTVKLMVSDTGYGLSQDDQNKMFTKFFRAESSAGKVLGTGLGLYITKLLVEKFGGEFGLMSELGKGSTFWFELPVTKRKK